MKILCAKLFTIILLISILPTAWGDTKLDPINQKIINNFRNLHIPKEPIDEKLVENYINDKNKVKAELLRMAALDEKVRVEVWEKIAERCQKKNLACIDDYNQAGYLTMELDDINVKKIHLFMKKYPWFKISEFGEDGSEPAWLIVQHSNDIGLKAKVLFIMEHLLKTSEVAPEQYALLYDRLTLEFKNLGMKQRYGSQFSLSEDHQTLVFEPCEGNARQVDKKRKELGLMSLKDNAERLVKESHVKEAVGLDFQ